MRRRPPFCPDAKAPPEALLRADTVERVPDPSEGVISEMDDHRGGFLIRPQWMRRRR